MNQSENNKKRRFYINLIIFIFLAILAIIWFQKHLQLYVTETLIVGGTLTLWGLMNLLKGILKWGEEQSEISFVKKIFNHNLTREYLIFGILIFLILYLTTSSVYLIYEGANQGESEFKVEILKDGNPYLDSYKITSYDRIKGKPFFFRLRFEELVFKITEPVGYDSLTVKFHPWTNILIKIPADFQSKDFNIVRLVPGVRLYNILPKVKDSVITGFDLKIRYKGEDFILTDIRDETIYIGANKNDIEVLAKKEDKSIFHSEIETYLIDVPKDKRDKFFISWENQVKYLSSKEFSESDSFNVEIIKTNENSSILKKTFKVPKGKTISTIFIE